MLPPLPASNPTPLYRLRDSLYAADLLTAALVELDLFTYLASGSIAFETLCSSSISRLGRLTSQSLCLPRWVSSESVTRRWN